MIFIVSLFWRLKLKKENLLKALFYCVVATFIVASVIEQFTFNATVSVVCKVIQIVIIVILSVIFIILQRNSH